jgi:hypothetical protein
VLFPPRGSYQAKEPCIGSDGSDTHECHFHLEYVVKVRFPTLGFRVKTHVLLESAVETLCDVTLQGALSWSSGALGFRHPDMLACLCSRVVFSVS